MADTYAFSGKREEYAVRLIDLGDFSLDLNLYMDHINKWQMLNTYILLIVKLNPEF